MSLKDTASSRAGPSGHGPTRGPFKSSLQTLVLLVFSFPDRPYPEGPPPAHTGGFGEPTCQACHADNPLNAPGGSLALRGLPAVYAPATAYRVTITLRRPGLGRAGFQLAARFATGDQAGSLS